MDFRDRSVMVTGGTGALGRAVTLPQRYLRSAQCLRNPTFAARLRATSAGARHGSMSPSPSPVMSRSLGPVLSSTICIPRG